MLKQQIAQQSGYKPFPIFDLRAGKVTEREPWLLPKDGFETLSNCHLKRGVLEKRKGYSFLAQMLYMNTSTKAPTLQTDPVMGIFNWYSGATEQLMIMDSGRINKYLGTDAIVNKTITAITTANAGSRINVECTGHGFDDYDVVTISGTTNYDGTYACEKIGSNNFEVAKAYVEDEATGTASQEKFLDITTSKIRFTYYDNIETLNTVQAHALVVGDILTGATSGATATVRAITVDTGAFGDNDASGTIHLSDVNNPSDQSGNFRSAAGGEDIEDADGNIVGHVWTDSTDDEFTGDNTNFFWWENWKEVSYISNNYNVIQKYDGTYLTRFHIDLDTEGGAENDVTRCLLIFAIKQRLIIFDVSERGATWRQRARWSEVRDPDTWKDANYIDADTDEHIIAADYIGDDLIVFFERSVWKFTYTADPDQPFRWERIDSVEGCYATMSLVAFSDEIFGVGAARIIGCDGREAYGIDKKIPDFVLNWNVDSVAYCYGLILEEEGQAWITYASTAAEAHADGNTYPDRVLVLNYDDNSFSTYELPAHVLGYSAMESDITWDISDAWEDIDWSWDEKSKQSGYPTTLMGGRDGKIYVLNDTGADNGDDIEFNAIGGRWNPFTEEGHKTRLGYIDFLVDVDPEITFDVKSYLNTDSTAFQTKRVTCSAVDGSDDKAWHRIDVNAVARFHRIEITNNASANRPRIHCICPWFCRAGRIF